MSEKEKSSKETTPKKKISNSQFSDLMESLSKRGIELSDEDKSIMSDGVLFLHKRKNRRGWKLDDEHLCFHHFFKGLDGNPTTEEMENFRSLYYELLKEHVDVVPT